MKQCEILAYAAGIVDGEGCISIGGKSLGAGKPRRLIMLLSVVNTNEWLIRWLKMQFGGNIRSNKPTNPRAKLKWIWRVESKKASEIIKLIMPYLQIKRPQAELAIEFQSRKKYRGGTLAMRCLTDDEHALNEADVTLMHIYNKKGIADGG
uniref:Putative HNH homing endonuclease n=1 Tax=viral metagenome TaxID=1070528 RepID=A0A6H2A3W2_9ZZZZ